jgi:hypothetical protein
MKFCSTGAAALSVDEPTLGPGAETAAVETLVAAPVMFQ